MTRRSLAGLMTLTTVFVLAPAMAHVVVVPGTVSAGQFRPLSFLIGEGCSGSATRTIRIEIPESIVIAKPQPKAGWTIEFSKAPLAKPVMTEAGALKERVAAITWRGGPLADEQFEQFTVLVRVPAQTGMLYFPATQTCERGEIKWTETPATSKDGLVYPAPALKITAATGSHGHGG